MVTFLPQPRCNSPPLNDLAIRSNEYLTSKRFFLTILRFDAIEGCEHRASARFAPDSSSSSISSTSSISFTFALLQTLCRREISQLPCFQSIPHSYCKNTGGGVSRPASSLQLQASRPNLPPPELGQNHESRITQSSHQHCPLSAPHRSRASMPLPSQRPFLRALPSPRGNRSRAGLSRGAHS
jgi:hypothetical protein